MRIARVAPILLVLACPAASYADSVQGRGEAGGFLGQVRIDVEGGPNGENATGQATVHLNAAGLYFGGAPSCLAVRGNVATFNIGTDPLLSSDGWGDLFTLEVTDNAGKGKPDVVSAIPSDRAPGDCSPFDFAGVTSDVTHGDFTVSDVSGPPRSEAACAHGRYKRFGFKSRRRCVAAARHAKHRHHRSVSHRRG